MRFITSTGFLIFLFVLSICTGQSSSSNAESGNTPDVLISENYERENLPDCTTGNIEIKEGSLCGKAVTTSSGRKVNAYLGIPFAGSPSGDNRWRAPVPVKGWKGVLKATELGPSCPQLASIAPQSEDCLTINVWVPEGASKEPRAVMVFIYGGAFIYGSSAEPTYDGAFAAAE